MTPPPSQPPGPPPAGPPPAGPPPQPTGPAQPSYGDGKGFFGALFDFSFAHFITPKLVKFAYILVTVLLALTLLVYLVAAMVSGEPVLVFLALVIGPLLGLVYLVFVRMTLEFFTAVVRMSEDIHRRLPGT